MKKIQTSKKIFAFAFVFAWCDGPLHCDFLPLNLNAKLCVVFELVKIESSKYRLLPYEQAGQ